jgi:hypothetical protein
MGTGENLVEGTHRVFQRHEFTLTTSEDLGGCDIKRWILRACLTYQINNQISNKS